MQVLPEGFALPPLPYLVAVLLASALVAYSLFQRRPAVTEQVVVSLAPWMAVGSGLYALFQVGAVPAVLAPLAGAPTVYLTTFVVAGAVFALVADRRTDVFAHDSVPGVLAATGTLALGAVLVTALGVGLQRAPLRVLWPGVALVGSAALAWILWVAARRVRPEEMGWVGRAGALVVFGHTLDGVSTAVGLEMLSFGEQTPLSQIVIAVGDALPTAQYVGGAWLFVVVKLVLALVVVSLLGEYVREEPTEGNLLLALVAAVGLGPGVHNVILFSIAG